MEDPAVDARRARLFWDPVVSPQVLPVDASPAGNSHARVLRLDQVEITTTVLRTPNGLQHVLFADGGRALQLAVRGTDVTSEVVLRADALPPARDFQARLNGMQRLADLNTTGRLRPPLYPCHTGARRLQHVLQSLDGWLAAAPQREIAMALFGEARVEREWRHPGDHLRDQVRRAVRRGRLLMAGAYRRFLC